MGAFSKSEGFLAQKPVTLPATIALLLIAAILPTMGICRKCKVSCGVTTQERGQCCPEKVVSGSSNPSLNGEYTLVGFGHPDLPEACASHCVYKKKGSSEETKYCFRSSSDSQAECKVTGQAAILAAMKALDFTAVRKDLQEMLTNSQDWWPADYGNYGPLLIRLAWHSAGSFRRSDGRGGGEGGRIRFDPERSWDDNTNLDKAMQLLWPIKKKYGIGLSWGDLIILAGNTAIESMGLPLLGFCGGRIDDYDGSESDLLGPTDEQAHLLHCVMQGECKEPLGSSTVGLIYVNPGGPVNAPGQPAASAKNIRNIFGRMSMNDSETVALIGGGHAFGKAHGACNITGAAGERPKENPIAPWQGRCGSGVNKGKAEHTSTSGFELPWTRQPTKWSNSFFRHLLEEEWEEFEGPGGHHQWRVSKGEAPKAPKAHGEGEEEIGMLTSDLALINDDAYMRIVQDFAENEENLNTAFRHAWYKLTTRDMGPRSRCLGADVPPAQPWQYPLPPSPGQPGNINEVKEEMKAAMRKRPELMAGWTRLAWRCMATFRETDNRGGCDGARVRLSPQKDWPVNRGLQQWWDHLRPWVNSLSWSDAIILAGTTALEEFGVPTKPFCGGRTDASSDDGYSDILKPKLHGNFSDSVAQLNEVVRLMGLTQRDFAVLNAAGYMIGEPGCEGHFCQRGESNLRTEIKLTNSFFSRLLDNRWTEHSTKQMYKAEDSDIYMLKTDLMYNTDPELRAIAEDYAADESKAKAKFLVDLGKAWNKLATADRYDGPLGNLCDQ